MRVLVARPRGFCAGVDRAIEIVELALELYGPPLYVRHAIVHNKYVVEDLARKGAIFVEEISEVPERARVVFSAHGVSPHVKAQAQQKELEILDATCPLVTKVHLEVLRYAREGYTIFLIGHPGHVEVLGTQGEAPRNVVLVSTKEEAELVEAPDPARVAYVTQTTLSIDDTRGIIDVLARRYPAIANPHKPDICYATQNRQDAVKALAGVSDVVFIVGSPQSSNSNRLVEVARAYDTPAFLIENPEDIEAHELLEHMVVGVSSGASTPEMLVGEVIERLRSMGATSVEELGDVEETMHFEVPRVLKELRTRADREIT